MTEPEPKPPLLKLPLEVLNEITKDFGMNDVCILRKTCGQLRRYVDNNEALFDEKIESVLFNSCYPGHIQFTLPSSDETVLLTTAYYNRFYGFHISHGDRRHNNVILPKLVKYADFATAAGNDLGMFLRRQKGVLKTLRITNIDESDAERMIDRLVAHLEDRKVLAREIDLRNICKEENLLKIFSCVNPAGLEILKLDFFPNLFQRVEGKDSNSIDRIINTEHWRGSKVLDCNLFCNTPLSNFHHFKSAKFKVESVSSRDLRMLKEAKLQDPSFEKFEFEYKTISGTKKLKKLLGKHRVTGDPLARCQTWSYRIPNTEKALVLKRIGHMQKVELEVKEIADLPDNAFG